MPCPPDHKHAKSSTCYTQHRCGCGPCRDRNSAYGRWKRRTPPERRGGTEVSAIGTRRRLQALMWLGYSPAAMGRHLGLHFSLVWRWAKTPTVMRKTELRVRRLYDELCMKPLDPQTTGERISVNKMRALARREGWHGPLAWVDVDMDDPDAQPDTSIAEDPEGWVVDELAHLHALGESPDQVAAQLGMDRNSLSQAARRRRQRDLARWIADNTSKAKAA